MLAGCAVLHPEDNVLHTVVQGTSGGQPAMWWWGWPPPAMLSTRGRGKRPCHKLIVRTDDSDSYSCSAAVRNQHIAIRTAPCDQVSGQTLLATHAAACGHRGPMAGWETRAPRQLQKGVRRTPLQTRPGCTQRRFARTLNGCGCSQGAQQRPSSISSSSSGGLHLRRGTRMTALRGSQAHQCSGGRLGMYSRT